jgi:hypothetical protein
MVGDVIVGDVMQALVSSARSASATARSRRWMWPMHSVAGGARTKYEKPPCGW